jgi:hypothetical protein
MKSAYKLAAFLLAIGAMCSCQKDIDKVEVWPEWPAPANVSVDGSSLDEMFYGTYKGIAMNLTQGQTVNFSGMTRLRTVLQSHYWDVLSETEAVFLGHDGAYDIIWDNESSRIFTEPREKAFPDELFLCGTGWGHQGAYKVTTHGWSWDRPTDMMSLRRVSPGVFEGAVYLAQGFTFKFCKDHLMGQPQYEIQSVDLKILKPEIVGGNIYGDFVPGSGFQPGVFNLRVDLNNNELDVTTNMIIEPETFYVNGNEMTSNGSYQYYSIRLRKGDEVTFGNFGGIESALQPDFWEIVDDMEGKAIFKGETGLYDIYLDPNYMIVYTLCTAMNFQKGNAVWVAGVNWGHPGSAPRVTATGWDLSSPNNCMQMKKVEKGVFEVTLWLPEGFNIKFFKARDWGQEASTTVLIPLPENLFAAGEYVDPETGPRPTGDLVGGPDFKPGTYTVRVDYNRNIVYAVGYYTPSE